MSLRLLPDRAEVPFVFRLPTAGQRIVAKSPSAAHNVLLDTLEHLSLKMLRLLDQELASLLAQKGQQEE